MGAAWKVNRPKALLLSGWFHYKKTHFWKVSWEFQPEKTRKRKGTVDSRRTKSANGKQSLSERFVWHGRYFLFKTRVSWVEFWGGGGERKYNGREFEKKGLSPGRVKNILKSVSQKHPEAYARLKDTKELREAVNMKCRKKSQKTSSKAKDAQSSFTNQSWKKFQNMGLFLWFISSCS